MAINKSSPWNDLQEKKNPTQTVRNSPWNNAVQTGNQEVTVQKRKLPEAPVKQGVDLTSLPGAAIGTGIAQTLSGASNLVKSVPVVAEAGARAISNLAKAPVSPMTSKLNAKEVEPNDDNVVQKLANALFKQEQEKTTVELPQTEQEITKNQFQNIANKEMIAQGQTPVKQITDWTNPWDKALAQNVENVQNAGQTYSRVVTPATDWLDNASQKVTDYTEREFMANLNPTEQFVAQAAGNAIPNFARNALLATVSGGSSAVLGLLSDAFMFAPSFYQGYEEGLAKGLSEEEAMLNATLRGVTEAGTEHLSDVWKVNGGQSKMDEWMLEKIAKSNLNPWAKFMGKGLASGIGESMEEVASRIGNTFADRAFYGNKIDAGQLALGSLEDAGASFISTMVMGLLGGEFSGTSRRQWNAYVDQMQNESAADVLNEAKDHKVELALTYASMSPNEAYDFVSKAQDIIRQKYGNDNEIANMDTWELVGKLDQEAVQIYDNLDDQLRQKYIDRMTNKELPLTQTTLPDGSTYNVYEYLGTRTTDQERALDMARRMGKDILFADELPMGQNALTLGDGTIIISSKAKRPATALAFHEIFHALKSDGQWNDLMDLAYNYMANEKGFSNFVEDLVSRYVSYYGNLDNNYLNSITASKELTDEQKRQEVKDYLREQGVNQYYADPNFHNMIDEEIAADFMERLNNEDSIKAMYNRSGDLFERTWQSLSDAVKNFAGTLTKDEQNLKKTEQLFAKVAQAEAEAQERFNTEPVYSVDENRQYYNERFNDRDGRVFINDLSMLSNNDWKTIQKAVDKLGYGLGSAGAAREAFSRYVPEYGFNTEQSNAIRKAFGVDESEKKQGNIGRTNLAKVAFGTTGNFNEAGYLLQDGKMLDFSGKREGGPPNQRAMDHRDIARVFDEELGDGSSATAYMNKFIDEGNIRLMPEQGVTIGEQEPTSAQYAVLKRFVEHMLDNEGFFYLDIQNENGNTIADREYGKGDKSSRIINDIKAYFKDGELPYRSQFADFRYSLDGDTFEDFIDNAITNKYKNVPIEVLNEHLAPLGLTINKDGRNYELLWERTMGGDKIPYMRDTSIPKLFQRKLNILHAVEGREQDWQPINLEDYQEPIEDTSNIPTDDASYMAAIVNGDEDLARKIVEKRAAEQGYTEKGYHGTQQFGFTVPDTQYSDDELSFFVTDDLDTAKTYSGEEDVRRLTDIPDKTEIEKAYEQKEKEFYDSTYDLASALSSEAGYYYIDGTYIQHELEAHYDDEDYLDNLFYEWIEGIQESEDPESLEEWMDSETADKLFSKAWDAVDSYKDFLTFQDDYGLLMESDDVPGNYELAVNPSGLLNVEARGKNWDSMRTDMIQPDENSESVINALNERPYDEFSTRSLARAASESGYPGVRISNLYDNGGMTGTSLNNPATVYALFNPQSQVKSLDTITYDDQGNIIPLSQRFNADNPDIRYSLDNEYLNAVEDGNVEEQDRIIEQAARNAGYNSPKVYHGTNTGDFTVFDKNMVGSNYGGWGRSGKGFYFTTDESDAKIWGERGRGSKPTRVIPAYLKMDNALDLYEPAPTPVKEYIHNQFAVPENWDGTFTEDFITKSLYRTIDFLQDERHMDASDVLQSLGYDGVYSPDGVEYVVYHPSQIKSAEPVTYDDDGNIILPSERFNPESNDIRYSAEEYIPESIDQANKYPDRRYQQTKGDMKVLGDIDRENNNTEDPERTQDVRPETFIPPFEPSDIKSYNELFEDGHEERNPNKEELEFYQSLNEKMEKGKGGNSAGGAIGFLTLDQYFDHAVGRNTEQRKILDEKFGRPMFEGKKVYTQNIREKNDGLKQIVEETGIYGGTDESAAVQWYGEGQKPIGDNKVEPYTLDDLKRDFPEKWEDIVKMEQYMRKQYDEYVDRWNAMLTQIYPHPERMLLRNLNSWKIQLRDRRSELELTDPNNVAAVEDLKDQIAKLEQKIADGEDAYRSGDYLRNKRLQPRKDYFHHIREVEQNGFGNVKNILQAITQATGKGNIDPDLVDVSQYTQPRTKWSGILQRRNSNDYTADAVTSFARYVNEAEYAIAMNPVISQYRDEISKIRKATKQTKNANTMIDYLAKYTNDLAGKTNYLDATMREFLGGEGNRNALLTAVQAINRRGKANAVVGNLRSAIAQFYNIPNALSVIKSLPAWRKGFNDYMSAKAGNRELLDQSPFLAERYGGLNEKDFQARDTVWKQIEGKLSDFSNKMMEFGDREATELIWLSAYNEGLEKGVDDPVYYADSMARRAVGGRGIGEVPFGMNSKLVGLFAPFQVEANNQWQNLKGMIEDKDAEGIFRLMLGSYLMNILARAIFNDGVLPDPLEALEEGIRRLFAKDREDSVGQIMGDTAKRVAGETVSMIPGTSLWLPLVMGDNAETFFGDSDPTRYGTGTVGVKNLFDVAADAINGDGFDAVTPLLNLGLPYGGKQVSRMYNTLQDLNVLPSNGFMNTPFGGEKNPTAGSYSNAGALRYQLPNEVDSAQDIVEIARALAFGSNSTDAAQEYFNNGNKPVLSKERVAKLREHPEVSAENYITYLKEASTDDKQGISQQEAYDWLSSHNLSDEERNALWEMTSNSWQKSYDEYVPKEETPKEEKTETKTENKTEKKSGKPTTKKEFTDAADANNSGRLSQAEAYDWLNSQKLSDAEKEALWNLMGWKTDYDTYASKH